MKVSRVVLLVILVLAGCRSPEPPAPPAAPAAPPVAQSPEATPEASPEPRPAADPGLQGNAFGFRLDEDAALVTLGEDVPLFRIASSAGGLTPPQRAQVVSERMNELYHQNCPTCGSMLLEPGGVMVGRWEYAESGASELVVFYAHRHGRDLVSEPVLLATIDARTTEAYPERTDRYIAGWWRDLTRDVIRISRGEAPVAVGEHVPAVVKLGERLQAARMFLGEVPASVQNLVDVLSELTAGEADQLRDAFETMPEAFQFEVDEFEPRDKVRPLIL